MFNTNAEFNGLSSAIYRNRILQSQLKILAKNLVKFVLTWLIFAGPVTNMLYIFNVGVDNSL